MDDECPNCRANLGRQAFDESLAAGDMIRCAECGSMSTITEHSDGYEDWMTFELLEDPQ